MFRYNGSMTEPIELDTARLRLRCWREADRAPFAALNADPTVMAFFPAPLGRAASDASIDAWTAQFAERGWSNWAVERLDSGEFILRTAVDPAPSLFSPTLARG